MLEGMKAFCLIVLIACVGLSSASSPLENQKNPPCGTIYDGLTSGKFDLDHATTSTIAANWFGFGDNVLFYEWAIFSDAVHIPIQPGTCVSQLRAIPDVQSWKNVQKQNSGICSTLQLKENQKYFSAVRATLRSGKQVITISDGVDIVNLEDKEAKDPLNRAKRDSIEEKNPPQGSLSCPIDETNRCRSGSISVAERLNELYGVPAFPFDESADIITFNGGFANTGDDDGDDDDGARYVWVIAPVLGVVLLALCLLILCLLLLLLLAGGCSLPERDTTPKKKKPVGTMEFENDEGDGYKEKITQPDATSSTVVEFPDFSDVNPNKLSLTHQDELPLDDDDGMGKPGRTHMHPIMQSASSSFRSFKG